MQENEFEKQVQQKMEELQLHPSESVWQHIAAHITKKKQRRVVWIFFLLLLALLFAGYWLMDPLNNSNQNHQNKLSQNILKKDSSA